MKPIQIIIIASLALAGCAGSDSRLAASSLCESSMPENQAVTKALFPSSGLMVPARSLLGSGKLDLDDTKTYACIDPKNKTNTAPNLHRIRIDHLSQAT